jgi:hypothetical protein
MYIIPASFSLVTSLYKFAVVSLCHVFQLIFRELFEASVLCPFPSAYSATLLSIFCATAFNRHSFSKECSAEIILLVSAFFCV